jgi:hypothetical protein
VLFGPQPPGRRKHSVPRPTEEAARLAQTCASLAVANCAANPRVAATVYDSLANCWSSRTRTAQEEFFDLIERVATQAHDEAEAPVRALDWDMENE